MGLKALPVETSLSSQYIDATTHDPAWIRSKEFSLETVGMGSTENRPPSARRKLACASFRATHRTILLDSISFITLIGQTICASSAPGDLALTESEALRLVSKALQMRPFCDSAMQARNGRAAF
jgi:hypothetical protein